MQFNANQLQKGGGSGLGLYIAKGIVTQHEAMLTARSDGIGHGTTFELVLPLWKLDNSSFDDKEEQSLMRTSTTSGGSIKDEPPAKDIGPEELASPPRFPKSLSSQFTRSLKVLVVDDVKSNRKLLKRLLENNGHECDEAGDGRDCVEMALKADSEGCPYASILLDYEMPVCDGPTAAQKLRESGIVANIIGITGNVLPDDVQHFKSCGANDVLAKPVKMPQLYASWLDFFPVQADGQSTDNGHQETPQVGYDYEV